MVSFLLLDYQEEAFKLSDRITVLRDGEKIGTKNTSETNQDEIVSMMVGKVVKDYFGGIKTESKKQKVVLEVQDYNIADHVYGVNFKLFEY